MKSIDKAKILVEEVKKENIELKERLSRINEISKDLSPAMKENNELDNFNGNKA